MLAVCSAPILELVCVASLKPAMSTPPITMDNKAATAAVMSCRRRCAPDRFMRDSLPRFVVLWRCKADCKAHRHFCRDAIDQQRLVAPAFDCIGCCPVEDSCRVCRLDADVLYVAFDIDRVGNGHAAADVLQKRIIRVLGLDIALAFEAALQRSPRGATR